MESSTNFPSSGDITKSHSRSKFVADENKEIEKIPVTGDQGPADENTNQNKEIEKIPVTRDQGPADENTNQNKEIENIPVTRDQGPADENTNPDRDPNKLIAEKQLVTNFISSIEVPFIRDLYWFVVSEQDMCMFKPGGGIVIPKDKLEAFKTYLQIPVTQPARAHTKNFFSALKTFVKKLRDHDFDVTERGQLVDAGHADFTRDSPTINSIVLKEKEKKKKVVAEANPAPDDDVLQIFSRKVTELKAKAESNYKIFLDSMGSSEFPKLVLGSQTDLISDLMSLDTEMKFHVKKK